MANGNWERLVGKEIVLIFDDLGKPSFKRCRLKNIDTNFVYYLIEGKEEFVPIAKIIRITEVK